MRDRNDFKAADVKWTGVMGENYFTLLLADWVTKPNAIKSCFHDGAVGKPKVLDIIDVSFITTSKVIPGQTIISVFGVQGSQFFFG